MDAKRREEIRQRDLAEAQAWTRRKMAENAATDEKKKQAAIEQSRKIAEEKKKPSAESSFVDSYSPSSLYKKLIGN